MSHLVFELVQLIHFSGSSLEDFPLLSDAKIFYVIEANSKLFVHVLRLESSCVNEKFSFFFADEIFVRLLFSWQTPNIIWLSEIGVVVAPSDVLSKMLVDISH